MPRASFGPWAARRRVSRRADRAPGRARLRAVRSRLVRSGTLSLRASSAAEGRASRRAATVPSLSVAALARRHRRPVAVVIARALGAATQALRAPTAATGFSHSVVQVARVAALPRCLRCSRRWKAAARWNAPPRPLPFCVTLPWLRRACRTRRVRSTPTLPAPSTARRPGEPGRAGLSHVRCASLRVPAGASRATASC